VADMAEAISKNQVISISCEGLERAEAVLGRTKEMHIAVNTALKRAGQQGLNFAARQITSGYAISLQQLKQYAFSFTRVSSDEVEFGFTGKKLPLIEYETRISRTPGALTAAHVLSENALKGIPRAFGHYEKGIQIFRRLGKSRFPIRKLYGPAISQFFFPEKRQEQVDELWDRMISIVNEAVEKRLEHEVWRVSQGIGR